MLGYRDENNTFDNHIIFLLDITFSALQMSAFLDYCLCLSLLMLEEVADSLSVVTLHCVHKMLAPYDL